jgi:hypothetical protein
VSDGGATALEATADPATGDDADAAGHAARRARFLREQLPDWIFVVAAVATVPLVLFVFGKDQWFLRDEWFVIAGPDGLQLFEPNAGSHWIAVPRLIYAVLWRVFGITTYWPYQLSNVLLHVLAIVMLRVIIRRSGVSNWLATAAAAPLLLFGPGSQAIVFGFQVGFTGSLAWGLAQLVLADTEGGFKRRDLLALGCGLLAITSSGIGVTTSIMVGIALLLRRNWRMAALHSIPLLGIYAIWARVEHASSGSQVGRPSAMELIRWDRDTIAATFAELAHIGVLGWLIVALLVVGVALAIGPWRDKPWDEIRRQWAMPVAMFVSIFIFASMTGMGRWFSGEAGARSSRYLYLQAVLLMPVVAMCAQEVARRWARLTPVLVVALVLPFPFNLSAFDDDIGLGKSFVEQRKYILTTAVRMPFALDVPRDVRPVPDEFDGDGVTIGFLLSAERAGRLDPSTIPLTPEVVNEFRIRLGFAQSGSWEGLKVETCEEQLEPFDLELAKGESVAINQPFRAHTIDEVGGEATSALVPFRPRNGLRFTAELPDLKIRIVPQPGTDPLKICEF